MSNTLKGQLHELVAMRVLVSRFPSWAFSYSRAYSYEDRRGVDITAISGIKRMYFQVKSSKYGVEKFRETGRGFFRGEKIKMVLVPHFATMSCDIQVV